MELELRHFKIICAVAEAGSITKAASVLGLAQPALTAQIHRIERALGGELFERDRRGARPTALGEMVLARAKLLLPAVSGLRAEAARLANQSSSPGDVPARVRLASANGPVLGGLVHHLSTTYPDLEVSTATSWSSDELSAMAADGRVDFVLVGVCGDAPPPRADLTWRTLAVDPVWVLLSADDPMATRDEVDLAELADARWAATPGDGCFGDCFAAACARAGFTPRCLHETDLTSCISLVDSGEAVVLCQPMFREMPGVVPVPLTGSPLRWRNLVGWHPEGTAAGFSDALTKLAVAAYSDVIARSRPYSRWLAAHPGHGVDAPEVSAR